MKRSQRARMRASYCVYWFCVSLLISASALADSLVGKVVNVHDGDTIKVVAENIQHSIRLAGIDAPELHQDFGQVSRKRLAAATSGKSVRVEWYKKDKYGRLVGKVVIDGRDVNLEQVQAGMAWHYVEYMKEQPPEDRSTYAAAELEARGKGLGLWSDTSPLPPWEWRKTLKSNQKEITK